MFYCMLLLHDSTCTEYKVVVGASLSKPQYSQEWYVRQVHKNLLSKNSLPYTAAEL